MKRVGIDGFSLNRNDSGIEVYTRELINGLLPSCRIELYSYSDITYSPHANLTVLSSGLTSPGTFRKLLWEIHGISTLVSPQTEIFHSPHFILPFNNPAKKKVVTVHDLAFLRHPEFFDWKTRLYYKLFLRRSLQDADAIICISKSCLDDVARFFPEVRGKLHLVYNGFKDFSKIEKDSSILSKVRIDSPFVLMIGTLNKRKNLLNAVRAFKLYAKGRDVNLVIVGSLPKHRLPDEISDSRIKLTGFVSEQQLSALYSKAELLLFPSFYEGFGFPVLEAMSAGLPVLTSNVSSLPEISGYPRELLCDPANVEQISVLIGHFLSPENRNFLKNHGTFTIQKFSWSKMVAGTASVYELLQKSI